MSELRVGYFCASCSNYGLYRLPAEADAVTCAHCQTSNESRPSAALLAGGPVDSCPHCGNLEFFLRKDFPQQLGCAVVTATVLISSVAYALWDFPGALLVLVIASLLDLFLYHRLDFVTVCYRCHAELRGFAENPAHGPFDMHRAEEYEQGT